MPLATQDQKELSLSWIRITSILVKPMYKMFLQHSFVTEIGETDTIDELFVIARLN